MLIMHIYVHPVDSYQQYYDYINHEISTIVLRSQYVNAKDYQR